MREIKFRAKNRAGDWCYGDLFLHCKHPNIKRIGAGNRSTYIDTDTIGQFTGLVDKNEKEIYEGDIVRMHFFGQGFGPNWGVTETDEEVIGEIAYCNNWGRFYVKALKPRHKDDDCIYGLELMEEPTEEIEVIGNKWDNTELL